MPAAPWTALFLALAAGLGPAAAQEVNPLSKVIELLADLRAKVQHEGETEDKAFQEYSKWCTDTQRNTDFEIQTASSQKAKLEARIAELGSLAVVSASKVEELAAAIAATSAEHENATAIRSREAADFAASEKELAEVVDALGRALAVLEREHDQHTAGFVQLSAAASKSVERLLSTVVDAASFNVADRNRLVALVQAKADAEDGDPAPAAYQAHTSSLMEVIEDLRDKAEAQLRDLRTAETNALHNYEMLATSLEHQAKADSKDLEENKAAKAGAEEGKAKAEGDLEVTARELQAAEEELRSLQADCAQVSADHEATVAARAEELKVLQEAAEVLSSSTPTAEGRAYAFLQVSKAAATPATKLVQMVKELAQQQHSSALAQLASRVAAELRYGGGGKEPFAKVRALIQDLIARLEQEAHEEATEKAYCDEETAKTETKKAELSDVAAKLTAEIDQASARSAELKAQVQELQAELAHLAKEQAEMDRIRQETHAAFVSAKADLEQGLGGVRRALGLLRDYYGGASTALVQQAARAGQPAKPEVHSKADGAGTSIIGVLEVVESDFATNLVKEEMQEADAQADYERISQENKVSRAVKTQDVDYKTREANELDKTVAELSSDHASTAAELDAVLEYGAKLRERCVGKPDTYEERSSRREAEIRGLKEALHVLESETALVQRSSRIRGLRGSRLAPQ